MIRISPILAVVHNAWYTAIDVYLGVPPGLGYGQRLVRRITEGDDTTGLAGTILRIDEIRHARGGK